MMCNTRCNRLVAPDSFAERYSGRSFDLALSVALKGDSDPSFHMNQLKGRSASYVLGVALVAIFALVLSGWVAALIPGLLNDDLKRVSAGVFLVYVGAMFLASYRHSETIPFLRGFMWICEHFSRVRHRKMAFVYFVVFTIAGIVVLMEFDGRKWK